MLHNLCSYVNFHYPSQSNVDNLDKVRRDASRHFRNKKKAYLKAKIEGRGVHRVLVGKPEGNSLLGRPRLRWEDNIKMNLQEEGGGCGDWMELSRDRDRWRALVSTVRNLRVPKMRGIS